MKSIIKLISFALSLLLALSLFGCSAAPRDTEAPIATNAPAATSAPTPEPEPTEDIAKAEAEAALKELDERMFAESVVSDALSFHLTVAHPENFPLITDYPTGWGEFTYAEQEASNEENIAWLEELYAIDRNALSDDSRITYDTLVQFLEQGIEGNQYYYYNEVLDTLVGCTPTCRSIWCSMICTPRRTWRITLRCLRTRRATLGRFWHLSRRSPQTANSCGITPLTRCLSR